MTPTRIPSRASTSSMLTNWSWSLWSFRSIQVSSSGELWLQTTKLSSIGEIVWSLWSELTAQDVINLTIAADYYQLKCLFGICTYKLIEIIKAGSLHQDLVESVRARATNLKWTPILETFESLYVSVCDTDFDFGWYWLHTYWRFRKPHSTGGNNIDSFSSFTIPQADMSRMFVDAALNYNTGFNWASRRTLAAQGCVQAALEGFLSVSVSQLKCIMRYKRQP